MDYKINFSKEEDVITKIKVVGVGGGGCNAICRMYQENLQNVELIACNTDLKSLRSLPEAINKIQLGINTAKGQGVGNDPNVGREAVLESHEDGMIEAILKDTDLVFITAGMGGGTGTGAAPVIAEVASQMGALVVAVVTKPFKREGGLKKKYAHEGIDNLTKNVDALISVSNDKIFELDEVIKGNINIFDSFRMIDEVLFKSVKGILDIIHSEGKECMLVDFADVKSVMRNKGRALITIAEAEGENRAEVAVNKALNSPLLDDMSVVGSTGMLVNITCKDLSNDEFDTIAQKLGEMIDSEALLKYGIIGGDELEDGKLRLTIVATGFSDSFGVQKNLNIQPSQFISHEKESVTPINININSWDEKNKNVRKDTPLNLMSNSFEPDIEEEKTTREKVTQISSKYFGEEEEINLDKVQQNSEINVTNEPSSSPEDESFWDNSNFNVLDFGDEEHDWS